MITDLDSLIFMAVLIALAVFSLWLIKNRRKFLLPRIYLGVSASYSTWVLALLVMKYTPPEDTVRLFVLDAITNIGTTTMPVLCLLIVMAFVRGWDKLPKKALWLFAVPLLTNIIIWTNPLHHLYYVNFSVVRSEIVFGPYMYVSGLYNYACMIVSIVMMARFMHSTPSKLYIKQGLLYILGVAVPLVVSVIATLGLADFTIASTPLSFIAALVFHGYDIYQLHMLDIQPIATQHVLDGISDCYLVLSDKGLILNTNQPFRAVFGKQYNLRENSFLMDCAKEEDREAKTPVYNLLTAVEACSASGDGVSYEQAVTLSGEGGDRRLYYVAEVTPLFISDKLTGYVCIFKDITALKNSLQQLENSRTRMMEQERLAFLGQMVGGLAHNLKTPIMSISGCASALENLVTESRESLADPDVNDDDYREIYGEMDAWVGRIRDSCSYMSDIITAIKGQAAHASASEDSTFSVSELIKRVSLLMRHELISSGCQLVCETEITDDIILHGDVNNLIQVLNNLISNAVYAQHQSGGGKIVLGVDTDEENLRIFVRDTGPGVDPRIRSRLFKEMTTSKGTQGTGLGLYISNAVVRGKFGGSMWLEDNPGGGSIFGMSIPLENVILKPVSTGREGEQ
jgi:two-component system, NtrC family, sensor histidine kinase HupT/HoxJ